MKKIRQSLCALFVMGLFFSVFSMTAYAAEVTAVYAGGVQLSTETYYKTNASGDVTADGTSTDYNLYVVKDTTNGKYVLYLKDATIQGVDGSNYGAGIYFNDNIDYYTLEIVASGVNKVSAGKMEGNATIAVNANYSGIIIRGEENSSLEIISDTYEMCTSIKNTTSCGIGAYGNIEILSGNLIVTAGKAEDDSCAIYSVQGGVTVSGGSVTATAKDASSQSYGIGVREDVVIEGESTVVTATSGNVTDGISGGIGSSYGRIVIQDGTVNAVGGNSENGTSYGMVATYKLFINGGEIVATAGKGKYSFGISSVSLMYITGGNIQATGGHAEISSYGIGSYGNIDIQGNPIVKAVGGTVDENGISYGISVTTYSAGNTNGPVAPSPVPSGIPSEYESGSVYVAADGEKYPDVLVRGNSISIGSPKDRDNDDTTSGLSLGSGVSCFKPEPAPATGWKVFETTDAHQNYTYMRITMPTQVRYFNPDDANEYSDEIYAAGDKIVLPDCTFTPPTRKVFDSWSDGNGTYNQGEEYTLPKQTHVAIYAMWKDETYTVFYDANGGTGTMEAAVDLLYNATSILPDPQGYFTAPTGKKFAGWTIGNDTTVYQVGDSFTVTGNVDVKAVWEDLATYTITYDANGGSGTMTNGTATEGTPFTLPANGFTAPEGKKFKAWGIGANEYAPGATYTFTGATTVKAVWTDLAICVVTFDADGGTGTMASVEVFSGDKIILPENGFVFRTETGYKGFIGWMVPGLEGMAPGGEVTVTSDMTIKAAWRTYELEGINPPVFKDLAATVETITATCNGEFSRFLNAKVDGVLLTKDVDYKVVEGSTILTLQEDYLKTLAEGNHTVTLVYNDGGEVSGSFVVEIATQPENTQSPTNTQEPSATQAPSNTQAPSATQAPISSPKTGDGTGVMAWMVMLMVACGGCMVLYRRKNN